MIQGSSWRPNLGAGKYSIVVEKEGFEDNVTEVELHGTAVLTIKLTIAAQQTRITVSEKSTAYVNSDTAYRQLRDDGLGDTFRCCKISCFPWTWKLRVQKGTINFPGPGNKSRRSGSWAKGHSQLKPFGLLT